MIIKDGSINAKGLAQLLEGSLGNSSHIPEPHTLQAVTDTTSNAPEIRQGLVMPELLTEALFRQHTDAIRRMFGRNV